ncbi:MAG: hypothetical protein Unbinned8454contig1000_26 [Prokaryotic dsDNA virus sp.]|nr:MAG: hypothetical protein Unbinned8454contig1000_26 [Prokaryotic dsDNA virus sp.]|tara:strand:+ start:7696 stop:7959 length:264 start_codon:yes stop_codon:yes gene_type:complete
MTKIEHFINGTKDGQIFSATFVKKDGSLRKITARRGVRKGVTGKGLSFEPLTKGLLPVYDMHKEGFRMINLNTLQEVKFEGITLKFN